MIWYLKHYFDLSDISNNTKFKYKGLKEKKNAKTKATTTLNELVATRIGPPSKPCRQGYMFTLLS